MTDRINSFTVVLDRDIREDDVEAILTALRMVTGVLSVEPNTADIIAEHVGATRERSRIASGFYDLLRKDV